MGGCIVQPPPILKFLLLAEGHCYRERDAQVRRSVGGRGPTAAMRIDAMRR